MKSKGDSEYVDPSTLHHPTNAHSHARALIGTAGEQLQIACGSNGLNSEGTGILFQYLAWFLVRWEH